MGKLSHRKKCTTAEVLECSNCPTISNATPEEMYQDFVNELNSLGGKSLKKDNKIRWLKLVGLVVVSILLAGIGEEMIGKPSGRSAVFYLILLVLLLISLNYFIVFTNSLAAKYRGQARECAKIVLGKYGAWNSVPVLDWLQSNTRYMEFRFLAAAQHPGWRPSGFAVILLTAIMSGLFTLTFNKEALDATFNGPNAPTISEYLEGLLELILVIAITYLVFVYAPLMLLRIKSLTVVLFENAIDDVRLCYLVQESDERAEPVLLRPHNSTPAPQSPTTTEY